ncbi:MAG: hypothetical protein K8E66_11375, partial [Phycisphaerales bacterium]|nr:hypothetical protein [Phycisphaerales bacterium]
MLLIDAFNVLHLPQAVHDGHALGVPDLAGLIAAGRYAGARAVLVCDGAGPVECPDRADPRGIEIVFSGPDRSADDEIED